MECLGLGLSSELNFISSQCIDSRFKPIKSPSIPPKLSTPPKMIMVLAATELACILRASGVRPTGLYVFQRFVSVSKVWISGKQLRI